MPRVSSTGNTVSAPVHPANAARIHPGPVRPSSLRCMACRLVKVAQCR